jgi:UDP-N-acetylmuramoyl-L-alanyl-D-glutamate--2,6-diaminopimelate ligase
LTAAERSLSTLLRDAGIVPLAVTGADPRIEGISVDSRRAHAGTLFFALPGERTSGESFVPEALARGAIAVLAPSPRPAGISGEIAWVQVEAPRLAAGRLAREWHGRPDEALTLVGITGTNGKSTVAAMVEAIARAAGLRAGRIGTVGIAVNGAERPSARTTPESVDLFAMLAEMRAAGVTLVAMEVSSHGLVLGRVEGARFRVAALLNLGRDHLDFHGTLDAYFDAKARLFEGLTADDTAVLPADDPAGARMASRTRAKVLRFGRSQDSDLRLEDERSALDGSTASLATPWGRLDLRVALPARFNLDNAVAAAACAMAAGLPAEAVVTGLASLHRVPGRLERVDAGQPFSVLVDFAHTEQALRRVLGDLRPLVPGRLTVVVGCGGERDRGKRPAMGRAAAELADRVVLTSDNPRGEDPLEILRDIEAGALEIQGARARTEVVPERAQAVRRALAGSRAGDAVLVAGKGHETTQTFADRVEACDDRELTLRALAEQGWSRGCNAPS